MSCMNLLREQSLPISIQTQLSAFTDMKYGMQKNKTVASETVFFFSFFKLNGRFRGEVMIQGIELRTKNMYIA